MQDGDESGGRAARWGSICLPLVQGKKRMEKEGTNPSFFLFSHVRPFSFNVVFVHKEIKAFKKCFYLCKKIFAQLINHRSTLND